MIDGAAVLTYGGLVSPNLPHVWSFGGGVAVRDGVNVQMHLAPRQVATNTRQPLYTCSERMRC